MSWYAQIDGEVESSLQAYSKVMDAFSDWTASDSGGQVEIERDTRAKRLRIRFNDFYRNLGCNLEQEIWGIAQEFPEETRGVFSMYSVDGGVFAASYNVRDGKLYRSELSDFEEILPPDMQVVDRVIAAFSSDSETKPSGECDRQRGP